MPGERGVQLRVAERAAGSVRLGAGRLSLRVAVSDVASAPLRDRLRQLDPKVRQSIVLSYVHGLSQPELAARLAEPLGTIRSWIRAGLAGLRELA